LFRIKKVLLRVLLLATAILVALGVAAIATGTAQRAYEAGRWLVDFAHSGDARGNLRPMMRAPLDYEVDGRRYKADIYRPLTLPRAAVVLLHGASAGGKDEPRLVDFAATLAAAGFIVLVPELVHLRKLQLRAATRTDVVDAVRYMTSTPELVPNQNLGIVAVSVAAEPAIMATLEPTIPEQLRFVLVIGGYYDMLATLTFATTGYFHDGTQAHQQEPNAYGKWVFALSNVEMLRNPVDRRTITAIAWRKLKDPGASVGKLIARLTPEGEVLYRFLANTDPARVRGLLAALPSEVKAEIAALSLSNKNLSAVRAAVILVHGRDDTIIPYSESIALARALPAERTQLYLVRGLFHVDLKLRLGDYWQLWRAAYALLEQRDEGQQE
jgi:pimeloyl-ACP methyl ester carboxylesterase